MVAILTKHILVRQILLLYLKFPTDALWWTSYTHDRRLIFAIPHVTSYRKEKPGILFKKNAQYYLSQRGSKRR